MSQVFHHCSTLFAREHEIPGPWGLIVDIVEIAQEQARHSRGVYGFYPIGEVRNLESVGFSSKLSAGGTCLHLQLSSASLGIG